MNLRASVERWNGVKTAAFSLLQDKFGSNLSTDQTAPGIEEAWSWTGPLCGTAGTCRDDETYIKVKGEWKYLYRAIDEQGNTIDFYLSHRRNAKAAKRFLSKLIKNNPTCEVNVINTDKNPSYNQAIKELKREAGEQLGFDKKLKVNTVKTRTHSLFRQGQFYYKFFFHFTQEEQDLLMNSFQETLIQHDFLATLLDSIKWGDSRSIGQRKFLQRSLK